MLSRDGIDKLWMKSKDIYEFAKLIEAAEPEQEPVGIVRTVGGYPDDSKHTVEWLVKHKDLHDGDKLYAAPAARKPLTDEEIDKIIASNVTITDKYLLEAVYMAIRDVEAAHGIGGEE